MLRPQPADDLVAHRPAERVLRNRPRHNLERARPPAHAMLRQTLEARAIRLHPPRKLKLRRARTGDEPRVLEERLDDVHAVVDRALEVVQAVRRCAAQHDRRRARLLARRARVEVRVVRRELPQHRHAVAADLDALEHVHVARLLRRRRPHAREWRRIDHPAEAAQLKLGEHLEDGNVEAVEVVQRELADSGAGDDDLYARCSDLLEDLAVPISKE